MPVPPDKRPSSPKRPEGGSPGGTPGQRKSTGYKPVGSNNPEAKPTRPVSSQSTQIDLPFSMDRVNIPGFEIVGELGRGNMGVIYKAKQTKLGRMVALKMILSGKHADQTQLKRFQIEAEAVGRLHHPNIVQVYNVGEYEDQPYLVMEYVDGGSLDRKLRGRMLPPKQAAQLIQILARAIQVAHDNGIIHRDLKPGNILLSAKGVPKITDFGLAKRVDEEMSATATGTILGTPSYMAPEQARANKLPVSAATDVYGLGAILYELLTGRPPFKEETFLDTMLQVVSSPPVPPREYNENIPEDLEQICMRCLAKDPTERFMTAHALAEALGQFLAHEGGRQSGRMEPVIPMHTPGELQDASIVDLAYKPPSVEVGPSKSKTRLNKAAPRSPIVTAITIVTIALIGFASVLIMKYSKGMGFPLIVIPTSMTLAFLSPQPITLIVCGLLTLGSAGAAWLMKSPYPLLFPFFFGLLLGGVPRLLSYALQRRPLPGILGGFWGMVAGFALLYTINLDVTHLRNWESTQQLWLILFVSIPAIIGGSLLGSLISYPVGYPAHAE